MSKIDVIDTSAENYAIAWDLLTSTYERKRILVSEHLDAIFDTPTLTDSSSKSLSALVDSVRQHVNTLRTLDLVLPEYVVIRGFEKALPEDIRMKWEESLSLDDIPTLDEFYTFIGGLSYRIRSVKRDIEKNKATRGGKRPGDREFSSSKAKRTESGSRALVTATSSSCAQCQEDHAVYRCPVFAKMSTQQRWDSVKKKNLCRNCLRKHSGECSLSRCRQCKRFHHTLLHATKSNASTSANKAGTTPDVKPGTSGNSQ